MLAQDRYGYAHLPASALLVGTERGRGKVRAALTPDPAPALRAALTPGPSPALRAALTPGPSPALRAALTPDSAPALRERGSCGLGIVDRRGRRIATATLSPATPLVDAAGGRGKVWGIIPPSSPAAWERKGGWGEGEGRPHPQPLSRAAGEE